MNNLIDDPSYDNTEKDLRKRLSRLRTEYGVTEPEH